MERASRRLACLRLLVLASVALTTCASVRADAQGEDRRLANRRPLPCGVDAVVGLTRILGKIVQEVTIEEISADYSPPNSMSLLDVAREVHIIVGTKPEVVEASFQEILSLDRPHIIHTTEGGCSECPEGGHVVAVERLAGEWAIIVQADGTRLTSAEQLRSSYGGHAVAFLEGAFSAPKGPRLSVDSYVADLGSMTAGEARPSRLTLRNQGTAPLHISRVDTEGSVACLEATIQLAPAEVGEIELSICPRHRLDRASDTRTYFVHIYSNDPIRPRTSVALRCTVVEPVIVNSPVVYFPRVTPSQPGERTIFLQCRPPVELAAAVPSHPAVTVQVEETGKSLSSTNYQLRISVEGHLLRPGIVQLPIGLHLKGVESEGAELIARVRVWPE